MTATYRPIRCPHGADLDYDAVQYGTVTSVYEDRCRTTSGAPVRFWCGPDEMSRPNGISITEGEYLRDWAEALAENENLCTFRGLISKRQCTLPTGHEEAHDVWGRSHHQRMLDDLHAAYLGEVPWSDRVEDW
jgi:hypothetical protein